MYELCHGTRGSAEAVQAVQINSRVVSESSSSKVSLRRRPRPKRDCHQARAQKTHRKRKMKTKNAFASDCIARGSDADKWLWMVNRSVKW